LDIIVGFSGESTLPEFVVSDMIEILLRLTVRQQRDIWKVIAQSLKGAERLLQHSAVTVIFKVGDRVEMREIGIHDPPGRVLGIGHFFCGTLSCRPQPMELRYSNKPHTDLMKESIRQHCMQCDQRSAWVKIGDIPWVRPLPGSKRIFWHDYPVTNAQMGLFVHSK
jgi:hypothetical protein